MLAIPSTSQKARYRTKNTARAAAGRRGARRRTAGPTTRETQRLTVAGIVTAAFLRESPASLLAANSCGRSQPPVAMVEARPMSGAELASVARKDGMTVVWLVKLAPRPKK